VNLAIVGGGPAGLRAAEVASESEISVTLYEGKPSVGRKFLVAGHGGLNLTHSEPLAPFSTRYSGSHPEGFWTSILDDFGNDTIREWARDLGIETFVGTSGRVFPKEFKAAPLLRAWLRRIRNQGVILHTRCELQGVSRADDRFHLSFHTKDGVMTEHHNAVILALGGASWPQTGSTAAWVPHLKDLGVAVTPFSPANCGWYVNWNPDILSKIEGSPLKNLTVLAGEKSVQGELMITKSGLEGGALYQLGSTLRSMPNPHIILDLKPTFSIAELSNRLINSKSNNIIKSAAKSWKLSTAAAILLEEFSPREAHANPLLLAEHAKRVLIPLTGPRPIAEAISSAGGVPFTELTGDLMVKSLPGLFLAGEMLDWEAPTGGYLLQGCFATGTRAGAGALRYLSSIVKRGHTNPISGAQEGTLSKANHETLA